MSRAIVSEGAVAESSGAGATAGGGACSAGAESSAFGTQAPNRRMATRATLDMGERAVEGESEPKEL